MIDIIPAIDIIDGKCVRLSQGDYSTRKIYNEDPLEQAKMFEAIGITRLHLVDLDGAKAHQIVNSKVLETITSNTNLVVDFGGGLKSDKDLDIAFASGASMVTGGSIAVRDPEIFNGWLSKYGADTIILGADAKGGKIAVGGWLEESELEIFSFLTKWYDRGVRKVISTDIAKDGMLIGPSFDLYSEMKSKFSDLEVIASGGVAEMDDIIKLNDMGIDGVIVGKAIYENRISYSQLESFISK